MGRSLATTPILAQPPGVIEKLGLSQKQIPNNVFLAPMAGVTDFPFRKLCRKLGAGMVVGEMTSSDISLQNTPKSLFRRVHLDEPEPRSIQIVGWDPAMMAEAARYNVAQGASIIDINMGCPAKKVCKNYAGSALLGNEDLVKRILDSVVSAVDVPVTLKIRTGIDPDNRNGVRIARIAEQSGVSLLAVHGRTRACKFKGQAEFQTIAKIKNSVTIPVIANGDLTSIEKISRVIKETGVDGIMIGRGAQGAPWFPGQVASYLSNNILSKEPNLETQRNIVLEHLDAIYTFYGEYRGVRIARKHIKWYLSRFSGSIPFLKNIVGEESSKHQYNQVSDFYLGLQSY